MKIKLFHNVSCHAWQQAESELEKALKEAGIKADHQVIVVESQKQAEEYKFPGSPTIQIDGKDIDPAAAKITQFAVDACRPYFWQGKAYDFPTKEMIFVALKNLV